MEQEIKAEASLQGKPDTVSPDTCPVRRTLEILSGKWRSRIL